MNKKSFLISILFLLFIFSCKSPNNPNTNNTNIDNGNSTLKVFNPNDYTSPDFEGVLPNTVNEISTTSDSPTKMDSNILEIQASLYCYYDKENKIFKISTEDNGNMDSMYIYIYEVVYDNEGNTYRKEIYKGAPSIKSNPGAANPDSYTSISFEKQCDDYNGYNVCFYVAFTWRKKEVHKMIIQ